MALDLGTLKIGVHVDTASAKQGLGELGDNVESTSKRSGLSLGSIAKGAAAVGGAILTAGSAAVAGLASIVTKAAEAGDGWLTMSRKTGVGVEELQRLAFAAKQTGVDVGTLEKAATLSQKALNAAAAGDKAATEAYKALGISIKDANGNLKSNNEIYSETITKLAGMKDANAQAAISQTLWGKSSADMLPLLREGADGINALKTQAQDMGIVMSTDAANAADTFGDSLDTIKSQFGGMMTQLGTGLMPILQRFLDVIMQEMPKLQPIFEKVLGFAITLLEALGPVLIDLVEEILPPLMDLLMMVLDEIVMPLMPFLVDLIKQILPPLIQIIMALLPPFMKLIEAIMPLIQLILPPLIQLILFLCDEVLVPLITLIAGGLTKAFNAATVVVNAFMPVINSITGWLKGLIDFVKNVFAGDWGKAWDSIKGAFTGVWNGIKQTFDNIWNGIKNAITIKLPHFSIDWDKSGFLADAAKFLGLPGLPKLKVDWYAQGGIVNGAQLVGVGEAGPEAIMPLSKLPELMANAMKQAGGGVTINLNGSYTFRSRDDIDYFNNRLALAVARRA